MTSVRPLLRAAELRAALLPDAVEALDDMLVDLVEEPSRLGRLFPAAARRTARGQIAGTDHRVEDAVRVELVAAAASRLSPPDLLAELQAVYRYGDADEKRAVLLALGAVDDREVDGSDVLLDALRTNDVRLVAAAMGPHADRLSIHDWRHGVLKCLFVGVPLAGVAGLATRADDELAAMVRRYVDERRAAGRPVPDDALMLLDLITSTTAQEA
ncbi:EboA domain-containing protein [Nocardioides sp. cx-173]|uniref:EboA domain-containing protein n=1 Tax=Nocardioides sp. cx-173 TaxID=2898796 RepID=UPI001E2DB1F6|nr:EboA domain-containing protein [Nocardioides sp. cx-173]MCD4523363.1 EboA domain-containing protein [Nocardioides sp. cx-173]UGB42297.1 EboA domain-containing protein [Nocardioides sp. cx-173]